MYASGKYPAVKFQTNEQPISVRLRQFGTDFSCYLAFLTLGSLSFVFCRVEYKFLTKQFLFHFIEIILGCRDETGNEVNSFTLTIRIMRAQVSHAHTKLERFHWLGVALHGRIFYFGLSENRQAGVSRTQSLRRGLSYCSRQIGYPFLESQKVNFVFTHRKSHISQTESIEEKVASLAV